MTETPHDMDECIQCGHIAWRHQADRCTQPLGAAAERKAGKARPCSCTVITALFVRRNPVAS